MRQLVFIVTGLMILAAGAAPAFAACDIVPNGTTILTPETRPAGTLIYNKDYDVIQRCEEDGSWQALGTISGSDGPAGCPNVGDECGDGSYFAGMMDGAKIYVTSHAHEAERSWNNGTSNWTSTGMGFCDISFDQPSCSNGHDNTALLVTLIDSGEPYQAATYCAGLSAVHGHSDWYLPSRDELALLWNGGSPIAEVSTSPNDWYWSSSEASTSTAWAQNFSDGTQSDDGKNVENDSIVRCARRDST